MEKKLDPETLRGFIGTENWYKHGLVPSITYTDGVKYVAENGGAYWLLDEIALANGFDPKVKAQWFQVWKLTASDRSGALTCEDGNGNRVLYKRIDFTDFPLPEITIWFTDGVMLLPSEY
jgi:hypothetical protein